MIENDRKRQRERETERDRHRDDKQHSSQHNSYVTRAERHGVRNKMVFQFEQVFQ